MLKSYLTLILSATQDKASNVFWSDTLSSLHQIDAVGYTLPKNLEVSRWEFN